VTEDLINTMRRGLKPVAEPSGSDCDYTAAIESSTYLMTHGVPKAPATVSHGITSYLWRFMSLPVQQLLPDSSRSRPLIVRRRQLRSNSSVSDSDMPEPALGIDGGIDVDSGQVRPPTGAQPEGEDVTTVPSKNGSWVGVPQMLQDPYADDQLSDDSAALVSQHELMGHTCPLFARKFAPSTSEQLATVIQRYIVR
jgi:hypothetical protein